MPFGGAAPAHAALLGGQVQAMFHNPVMAVPAVQAGRLRALATTGAARAVALPEVPTLAESGYPGFDSGTWYAVLGPAGMPAPVVARIDADLRRAIGLRRCGNGWRRNPWSRATSGRSRWGADAGGVGALDRSIERLGIRQD